MHFALDGGYVVREDGGGDVIGSTRNFGGSVELNWRGVKVNVSHMDLLRSLVGATCPEELDDFDAMREEMMLRGEAEAEQG
jgi:hypothetical protein